MLNNSCLFKNNITRRENIRRRYFTANKGWSKSIEAHPSGWAYVDTTFEGYALSIFLSLHEAVVE